MLPEVVLEHTVVTWVAWPEGGSQPRPKENNAKSKELSAQCGEEKSEASKWAEEGAVSLNTLTLCNVLRCCA